MKEGSGNGFNQYVIFSLSGETYGIPVTQVKEIITFPKVTRVPRAPAYVEGIINLRGNVITITNLHKRLGLGDNQITSCSRIVVVEGNSDREVLGMVVDGVSEVLPIGESVIEPPSDLVGTLDTNYLLGVANCNERLILLLDLEKVLSRN